jgi:uncharacterized membrane protein
MGYAVLILGVALWTVAHLFKRLAPAKRAAMGNMGKILVALALAASIVLMVLGYKNAGYIELWTAPAFLTHVNNLLMVLAFWLFMLSHIAGTIAARIRHKQLTAVKIWAIAHLLVNGDLASVILFGGLMAWAVLSVILINRAEPEWQRPANPSLMKDGIALVAGLVAMVAVAWIHAWLGYWPFGGGA